MIGGVSPTPDICRDESLPQLTTIGTDPLVMNVLPPSSGSGSLAGRMEIWVLNPVVAPQFLEKTTAFNVSDGEEMVCETTFSQTLPQPARSDAKKTVARIDSLTGLAR